MMRTDTVGSAPTRIGLPAAAPSSLTEFDAFAQRPDRRAGMALEDVARPGNADAAAVPLDDRHPECLLEFAQRLGNRRLTDIEGFRGPCDAFLPCDLQKCLEMAQANSGSGR